MTRTVLGIGCLRFSRAACAFVLGMMTYALPTRGAEIEVISDPTNPLTLVRIQGALELADGDRFATIASQASNALIIFASDGGRLIAGLRIGQLIRLHGFATLVPDGARCASACAIAWLGGAIRFMQPTARIGFHAAYRIEDGVATESGSGNALVGAYLSRLGLSDSAILYIERARPNEITWLTKQDAEDHGIEVAILPPLAAPPTPKAQEVPQLAPSLAKPPTRAPQPYRSIAQYAAGFVSDYFAHWSESNSEALNYFTSVYAPHVDFYGKPITRELLLEQKRKFAERWPQRVYTVRSKSISTHCDEPAQACVVTGTVDWDIRNAQDGTHSDGTANITFRVIEVGGVIAIESESGSVVSRGVNSQ